MILGPTPLQKSSGNSVKEDDMDRASSMHKIYMCND
jgi:hypothetical protein